MVGMPDLRFREFEGRYKDEFARSNNCIVHNQGNKHENGVEAVSMTSKKLKHGVDNGKGPQSFTSETGNTESKKCNSEHMQSSNGTVLQDTKFSDECLRGCNVDSDAFALRAKGSISETRDPTENCNSCHLAPSNASPVVNDHSVPQSDLSYGDNDLPYIDWPGIDNFEDVDNLFRKCDSTYGQHQLETSDELSWLPSSSDDIYTSSGALQLGFQSLYSDYGFLDDLTPYHCPDDRPLPIHPSTAICDKQFNDDYPFGDERNMNVYSEEAYPGNAMQLLPIDQMCNGHDINGYEDLAMIGSQYSSENALEQLTEHKFSSASASQIRPPQNLQKQKQCLDSNPSSYVTSKFYPESNSCFSPPGASLADRNSKVQNKVAKLQQRQLGNDDVVAGQCGNQSLTIRAFQTGKNHEIEKNRFGKRSLEGPKVVVDSSMVVDGSFASSISSDNSPEQSSFRQLQDTVSQLDVKTKLCIRDSLYRLARNAQDRQVFSNVDCQDAKEMKDAETLDKFGEPVNTETQTNPIDRSIAQLLFHRPPDCVHEAADDVASLKSQVINERHQAPTENQCLAPKPPIYSPRGSEGSINTSPRKNAEQYPMTLQD